MFKLGWGLEAGEGGWGGTNARPVGWGVGGWKWEASLLLFVL